MASLQVKLRRSAIIVALVLCVSAARAAGPPELEYIPGVHDANALGMLVLAHSALEEYSRESSTLERRINCSTAVEALTGLYQLYGCEWALGALRRAGGLPECPPLIIGYSLDGRLRLRVENLELKNPAFAGSTVCLCTLQSQSSLDLTGDPAAVVEFILADGTHITPVAVDESHPQWEQLDRLAATFLAPDKLLSGSSVAFKQFFALEVPLGSVSAVSLVWGNYGMVVPNYMLVEGL